MQYDLLLLNVTRYNTNGGWFQEYLGGHIIASFISQFHFSAKVFSCHVSECTSIITKEITQHGVEIIGFYIGADNAALSGHVMKWVKENFPDIKILSGGPECYALGEKFIAESLCDYIVYGEGENSVLDILRYELDGIGSRENIRGIKYISESGKFTVNLPAELIHDLDSIPFPDRNNSLSLDFRTGEAIGILTGRGCPFHCGFCFEGSASKTVRLRSVANVIAEIELVRKYNRSLKCVNIYDDTFTLSPSRVRDFCMYMKDTGLLWTCEAHVSVLYHNPEMIRIMAESGLIAVQIGIESGNKRVLEAYNKNITPEMIIEVVRMCKSAGVYRVEGNYILGGAFESEQTLTDSINHAKTLITNGRGIMEINTVFFAPYFGTPVTKNPEHYGMKINSFRNEHTAITMREAVTESENLTLNEIVRAKEFFEREITEHYIKEALLTTRDELIHGTCRDIPVHVSNTHWLRAWRSYPHISDFMEHLSPDEQKISPAKYPVRTLSAYAIEDDKVSGYGVNLSGEEARAILFANGRRTVQDLSDENGIAPAVFESLNNKCLVYFSDF
ncbi:MAG: radical SAM protein [Synergistaceae bacterium]|nr:radical SAM protein [Synergistaceae bacterium]